MHESSLAIEASLQEDGVQVGIEPPAPRIPWVCGSRFTTHFIPGMGGNLRCCARRVTERERSSSLIRTVDTSRSRGG